MGYLYTLSAFGLVMYFGFIRPFQKETKYREKAISDVVINPGLVVEVLLNTPSIDSPIYCNMRLSDGRFFYVDTGTEAVRIHDAWKRGDQHMVLRYLGGERGVFDKAIVAV